MSAALLIAQGTGQAPAGGAAIGEIILATAGAAVATAVLLTVVFLYRAGRLPALARVTSFAERVSGIAGWAALPGTFLAGTLVIAVFGMYWDISLHLDAGRDVGPLANPSHYFILVGLFGVLTAGVLAMALPRKPSRSAVRLPLLGWQAPVGALLVTVCGAFSLIAFPLDDVWHRIFGQDVTLWGPTHLMLLGGASFSILGAWALHVEGVADKRAEGASLPLWTRLREVALAGAFLLGMNTFPAEYDFGIPQWQLWFHPLLLMLAAGVVLVLARIRMGPGGALAALIVFLAIRGLLAVLVGPVLGQSTPQFPLYLVEALCVEAVALLFFRGAAPAEKPLSFGLAAGAAIGTVGLAAEWAWSHVWVVLPWPAALFPEGAIIGLLAALGGGVLGGFLGRCLTPDVTPRERAPRWAVPAAAVLVVGLIAFAIPQSAGDGQLRAAVTLRDLSPPPVRTVQATFRLQPPEAARDADWLAVTNWQEKRGPSTIDRLREIGPGVYQTTVPIHVGGAGKTTVRFARGREVLSMPLFLPEDKAIPAPEVPATAAFTRPFVLDKTILQRELKAGVSPVLTWIAYLAVLAIYLTVLGVIAWGLLRLERRLGGGGDPPAAPAAASDSSGAESGRLVAPPGARPAGGAPA